MYSCVTSGALLGIDSYLAMVEVDASGGLPGFEMVGMLNTEVKEAKERVRVALKNSRILLPPAHITVNISPANVRKYGTAYDLPIAISLLIATGTLPENCAAGHLIVGELGLNGEVKFVNGILPIVMKAKEEGIKTCIVPKDNAMEGGTVPGIDVIGIGSLEEVMEYFTSSQIARKEKFSKTFPDAEALFLNAMRNNGPDYSDVCGQESVKRGAEIAAAGFHNLLFIGSPGSGKTMIAKRIPSILPPLTLEESMEVSKIYSVAGMLHEKEALIVKRPFCSPHHTISEQALVGGGRIPRPGAVSLAHRGVLFLDEVVHFKSQALESLRQPLEDKTVQIARNFATYTYPADFMLVAAMNPCPCGYYPDRNRCKCTPGQMKRYLSGISGPVLDRIDICVEAPRLEISKLSKGGGGESSGEIRKRIEKARSMQRRRFAGTNLLFNADMGAKETMEYCVLGAKEKRFVEAAFQSMELSARAYHKILKVARTIADLDGKEEIGELHLAEALGYRSVDRRYW